MPASSPETDTEGYYEADGRSPAEFRKLVQEEVRRFAEIVRTTKIQTQ